MGTDSILAIDTLISLTVVDVSDGDGNKRLRHA
jgi:hypothetical protein